MHLNLYKYATSLNPKMHQKTELRISIFHTMASPTKLLFSPTFTTNALRILLLLFSLLHSSAVAQNTKSFDDVCQSTPHPSKCRSILPHDNPHATVHDYGRFSMSTSLNAAHKFKGLVRNHLSKKDQLSTRILAALEDCQFLVDLTIDFLTYSSLTVNGTSSTLSTLDADYAQTILSAVLTNAQTCQTSIEETDFFGSLKGDVITSLIDDTSLFSVALSLFTQGWVPDKKTLPPGLGNWHPGIGKGHLRMQMSDRVKAIFDKARNRRRLLQSDGGSGVVTVKDIVVVSKDGSGNFTNITAAVASAPLKSKSGSGYYLIYVKEGIYEEYVYINQSQTYVMMLGDGINKTIITGNHSVGDNSTTFNSYSFAVVGEGFLGVNITFRNTAGAIKHQAVAVRNGADMSTFYSCSFEGYQDTLYTHSLRQFYRECDIYGTVDFIFGDAAVVFQDCNIYARLPMSGQFNTLTAQGRTDPNQNSGTSFLNCTVKATPDLAASNTKTYLGRPWKEYSRTVFSQSFLDSLIQPEGWHDWSGDFALSTLYYAEFNNRGPGSNTTGRVTWPGYHVINATDAANFTVAKFILGDSWLWQTGVPYFSGLLP